jgi:hypothetical protein
LFNYNFKHSAKAWSFFQAFLLCTILLACSSLAVRQDKFNHIIKDYNYSSEILKFKSFDLLLAKPARSNADNETLHLVIEGDGFSWVDKFTYSSNPTPLDPYGLKLAGKLNALYLARPCQYIFSENCDPKYWTDKRFSYEIINLYMHALDSLKLRYNVKELWLTGYSGGAYIALVLAAYRDDIKRVDTVFGLLSPSEWTRFHNISSIEQPLELKDLLDKSRSTSFYHWCGEKDNIIPCHLHHKAIGKELNHKLFYIENADHDTFILPENNK